jgi:hypothetical protein
MIWRSRGVDMKDKKQVVKIDNDDLILILKNWAEQYLDTLDDKEEWEYWMTERYVQSRGIHRFIEWLEK